MGKTTALFLAQSYQDAWEDYCRSFTDGAFPAWDYVILTASDGQQAEGFRGQLEARREYLPRRTHFAVIPDEGGVRVGSGGATLSVLRYIRLRERSFEGLRILVIHSGGDSRRVPQYSALGKLFSPVPRRLPNGRRSTLFDELMIAAAAVPGRIRAGMLVLSGDVLLLFNPLQVSFSGSGAAAISFREDVQTGKNHGVFLRGEDGNVARFLHKQTVETLRAQGAVDGRDCVDIDTGAVIFGPDVLAALYSLIPARDEYLRYVNSRVRLSLYGDFLYPLASESTLEQYYREKPEGDFCEELRDARTALWQVLRPYRMKLLCPEPAKFIHLGTTREVMALMDRGVYAYKELGWSGNVASSVAGSAAGYNSILAGAAVIGEHCYLEAAYVHGEARIGRGVLLSNVEIRDGQIPDGVVLHGLKQKDGKYVVRIYGVDDNPKEGLLFGKPLDGLEDLWDSQEHSLWTAALYPACDTLQEAVAAARNVYALMQGEGDPEGWKRSSRKSLRDGFRDADPAWILAWDRRMEELVPMEQINRLIREGRPAGEAKQLLKAGELTQNQQVWLREQLQQAEPSGAMRLYYYLGTALENDAYMAECFRTIRDGLLQAELGRRQINSSARIRMDSHRVLLPLRVNWGGGWTDTPPYCLEQGGTVLNAAILLDGRYPVEVRMERLEARKVVFDSRDMDVHGEFDTIAPLQTTDDPYDPFVLQKACLLACGIIPGEGGELEEILDRLGGGFAMHSEVTNVPKGSGLGTSSILSAACVKCVFEFMGIGYTQEDLYSRVLVMEQLMSTGGGWQDQVGGLSGGIQYITSGPGMAQQLKVERLELSEETMGELNSRFCLIYTGQRRLARKLLRDVVCRYVGNEPDTLAALAQIRQVAAQMREALERGDVDAFAALLECHWTLSRKVEAASANGLIDRIFAAVEDLTDGRMVCGAGGGGFLQVILKRGVSHQTLHRRLKEVFPDSPVDVWSCKIL